MLLPDNVHPRDTIYFNGAAVLETIREHQALDLLDLYIRTKENRRSTITMPVFVLCVDWLFLLDLVGFNDHGKIELCF